MDLLWGISVEESLGLVGLALGIRAELRGRVERRRDEAARKAVATAELTSFLTAACALTVNSPSEVANAGNDDETLQQLSQQAYSAISNVAPAFPTAATTLDDFRRQALQIRATLKGGENGRPIDRSYQLLYAFLVALSYYALARHEVSGSMRYKPLVESDEFVARFGRCHEAFQVAFLASLGVKV